MTKTTKNSHIFKTAFQFTAKANDCRAPFTPDLCDTLSPCGGVAPSESTQHNTTPYFSWFMCDESVMMKAKTPTHTPYTHSHAQPHRRSRACCPPHFCPRCPHSAPPHTSPGSSSVALPLRHASVYAQQWLALHHSSACVTHACSCRMPSA